MSYYISRLYEDNFRQKTTGGIFTGQNVVYLVTQEEIERVQQ